MKSAIGIGTLLADGLGDTIRVSLTEDPEYEFAPCNRLADLGGEQLRATELQRAVPPYVDARDITSFSRRSGRLPEQREGDDVDFRGLLHRDGSVLSAISLEQLAEPDALQRSLGCKSVLGMPFKDVATSDSLLLRELPPASDKNARLSRSNAAKFAAGPRTRTHDAPAPRHSDATPRRAAMRRAMSARSARDAARRERAAEGGGGAVPFFLFSIFRRDAARRSASTTSNGMVHALFMTPAMAPVTRPSVMVSGRARPSLRVTRFCAYVLREEYHLRMCAAKVCVPRGDRQLGFTTSWLLFFSNLAQGTEGRSVGRSASDGERTRRRRSPRRSTAALCRPCPRKAPRLLSPRGSS